MPQQLKVFQDPSIVRNVPSTALERLQIATEAKAAQMAQQRGADPYSEVGVSALYNPSRPVGTPFTGGWGGEALGSDRLPQSTWETASGTGVDPAMAYSMGEPGANQGPGPQIAPNAALTALYGATSQAPAPPVSSAPSIDWQPVAPTAAPAGDPWTGMRVTPLAPTPGLTTAPRAPARAPAAPAARAFSSSSAKADSPIARMFAPNTMLPASMNNRRWAGDGY